MRVKNLSTGREVACNAVVADTLLARLKGLLGREALADGEAMLIRPCKGVHTFGMSFAIDVLFLDARNRVIACNKGLAPNRLTPVYPRAACVIELPAGIVDATATGIGDQLEIV